MIDKLFKSGKGDKMAGSIHGIAKTGSNMTGVKVVQCQMQKQNPVKGS